MSDVGEGAATQQRPHVAAQERVGEDAGAADLREHGAVPDVGQLRRAPGAAFSATAIGGLRAVARRLAGRLAPAPARPATLAFVPGHVASQTPAGRSRPRLLDKQRDDGHQVDLPQQPLSDREHAPEIRRRGEVAVPDGRLRHEAEVDEVDLCRLVGLDEERAVLETTTDRRRPRRRRAR